MTTDHAPFRRARSEEQRSVRRDAILRTAAAMLTEMPVADLSLNELGRRAGMAKSNVLRYFESREAVLLDLFDTAWRDWLNTLAHDLPATVEGHAPADVRCRCIADTIATNVMTQPLLWQLMSVSAAVLERNISPAVARRYKLTATANTEELARLTRERLPELTTGGAYHFAGATLLMIGAMWPLAHPAEALLHTYDDPDMAATRIDAPALLRDLITTLIIGCLTRWPTDTDTAHAVPTT